MKELIQLNTFRDVLFDEKEHKYSRDGYEYISVTTFLKSFYKPFRREYWAKYKSLEALGIKPIGDFASHVPEDHIDCNGEIKHHEDIRVSTRDVYKLWEEMSLEGLAVGSMLHYYLEFRWAGNTSPRFIPLDHLSTDSAKRVLERCENLYPIANKFVEDHAHLVPIKLEQTVADLDMRMAGKPDAIVHNLLDGQNYIYDYKTDKKISYDSKYGDKLLGPLSHLDECEYNKYSLQLALYKHMVNKHTDLNIRSCFIAHFSEHNYQIIETEPMEEEIRYLLTVRSCQV